MPAPIDENRDLGFMLWDIDHQAEGRPSLFFRARLENGVMRVPAPNSAGDPAMSILASLAKAYDRLPDAPPFGYSTEKIGFVISLNDDGTVASVTDLREGDGKKKTPRLMQVPQPTKRTVGDRSELSLGQDSLRARRDCRRRQADRRGACRFRRAPP